MNDPVRELAEKATPGPWEILNSQTSPFISGGAYDPEGAWPVAEFIVTGRRADTAVADALLISLSPDLARVAADLAERLRRLHHPIYVHACACGTCSALAAYRQLQERAKQ